MSESDFAEFIRILRRHRVRFLVIGGYAMAHHGLVRATNDVDVLVATDKANVARIRAATLEFVGVEPNESALRPPRGMFRIGPPAAHVDVTKRSTASRTSIARGSVARRESSSASPSDTSASRTCFERSAQRGDPRTSATSRGSRRKPPAALDDAVRVDLEQREGSRRRHDDRRRLRRDERSRRASGAGGPRSPLRPAQVPRPPPSSWSRTTRIWRSSRIASSTCRAASSYRCRRLPRAPTTRRERRLRPVVSILRSRATSWRRHSNRSLRLSLPPSLRSSARVWEAEGSRAARPAVAPRR